MFRLVFTAPASDTVPAFLPEIFFVGRLEGWTVYCDRRRPITARCRIAVPMDVQSSTSSELPAFVSSRLSGLTVSPTRSFQIGSFGSRDRVISPKPGLSWDICEQQNAA
jgi:hypothetical protein